MSNDEWRIMVWGFALRATTPQVAFGYDPTGRSGYYITTDHLTFILFKKLTPKSIFVNTCIPKAYKEPEKCFALFAQNWIDNCLKCIHVDRDYIAAVMHKPGPFVGAPWEKRQMEIMAIRRGSTWLGISSGSNLFSEGRMLWQQNPPGQLMLAVPRPILVNRIQSWWWFLSWKYSRKWLCLIINRQVGLSQIFLANFLDL